jgi:predicted porin
MDPATDLAEMLESMPTIYGNIQLAHVNTDDGDDNTSHELGDNGSTIGFKHSSAISEGVEGFFKAEFEFDADDKGSSTGLSSVDEAYIGVKGDFGMIQAGTDDTVAEWVDMIDTSEAVGIAGSISGISQGDNLQYVSPEIADGLVVGATIALDDDGSNASHAGVLAGKYAADNLEVALSYVMARGDGEDTVGLGGTYSMDDLTLIAQYETTSDAADFIALQGMYTMGQNQFALGYGMTSFDDSSLEDQSSIYVQALHNVSSNMYVYLEYKTTTDLLDTDTGSQSDLDELALGAAYAF